uniref:Uncharacterized protein n=1 Tax=Brassica oleracea var. oleracea TaxID=109376 RepID=A0A0D3CDN6_BRAOL
MDLTCFFGYPRKLNDITIMDRSPVFDDVEQGNTPRVNFFFNQRPYNTAYNLDVGFLKVYQTSYLDKFRRDVERTLNVHLECCMIDLKSFANQLACGTFQI